MATQRIIVGISGASGFQYGVRRWSYFRAAGLKCILSCRKARKTCELETDYRLADVTAMADVVHSPVIWAPRSPAARLRRLACW